MATTFQREEWLTVEQFLDIDFGDHKAELDKGYIRMMAGGTGAHARVQANILARLFIRLQGSGCRPYGSDMGVRSHDMSLRYPDVSVFCGRDGSENDDRRQFDDPKIIVEILSSSTAAYDQSVKLEEYRALPSVDAILFVDTERERVRAIHRAGPEAWTDAWLEAGADVTLPTLGVTLPAAEIFARD